MFNKESRSLSKIFSNFFTLAFEYFIAFIIIIILILFYEWRTGLINLFFIIVYILYSYFKNKYMINYSKTNKKNYERVFFKELLKNSKIIKLFNGTESIPDYFFIEKNVCYINERNKIFIRDIFLNSFGVLLIFCFISLLIYISGVLIYNKTIEFPQFISSSSILFLFLLSRNKITKLIFDYIKIQKSLKKFAYIINHNRYRNIFNQNIDLFNYEREVSFTNMLMSKLRRINGKIEFKNVTFIPNSYNDQKEENYHKRILKNISFIINPGEKVGFIINSEYYERRIFSCIILLLLRYYKPEEGEILIDDININNFEIKELNTFFLGVFNEVQFLNEKSVLENIRLGNPESRIEEIQNVFEKVGIEERFINGDNNEIIEDLSNDLIYKMSIASCFLRKGKFMFFEQPSKAIESINKNKIMETINNHLNNCENNTILIELLR